MTSPANTIAVVFFLIILLCGVILAVGTSNVSADTPETAHTTDNGDAVAEEQSDTSDDDDIIPKSIQLGDLVISGIKWTDTHAIIRGEAATPTAMTVTDSGASASMGPNEYKRIGYQTYRLERGETFEIRFRTASGGDDAVSVNANNEMLLVTGESWEVVTTDETPTNSAWVLGLVSGITGFIAAVIAYSARDAKVNHAFSDGGDAV
jgi:hypothetical protein